MPQLRSLRSLLEDLSDVSDNLEEYQADFPADSKSLADLETAVATLERLAREAEDFAQDRCEDCECNPCECETEEDEDDE